MIWIMLGHSLFNRLFFIVATGLVSRQVVHCHRVLRTVQSVAEKSTVINSKTWDALLRFLLAVNDVLLAPPTEKGLHFLALSIITLLTLFIMQVISNN